MSRIRIALSIAILAALASTLGIVLIQDPGDRRNAVATSNQSSTITTRGHSITTSTTMNRVPVLQNTGQDFDSILKSLVAYREWLNQHPDPNLLTRIYERTCPCFDKQKAYLSRLREKGWRHIGSSNGLAFLEIRVAGRPSRDIVSLDVLERPMPTMIVDRNGRVVRRDEASKPRRNGYVLRRNSEGRWLIAIIEGEL